MYNKYITVIYRRATDMVTREEMIETVIKSTLPIKKIDVGGKGSGVTALRRGKKVSDKKLETMYNSIQELNNIPKVEQELPTEKQEVYNEVYNVEQEKIAPGQKVSGSCLTAVGQAL
jgi:hypothetical protein